MSCQEQRRLRIDALLEDMETIAASGAKLNLNYAVSEMLDEYGWGEIIEYFKSCETSSPPGSPTKSHPKAQFHPGNSSNSCGSSS